MNKKTKQIIIAVVVIIVAFVGFKMYFDGMSGSTGATSTDDSNITQPVDGQAILSLLNRLKMVSLNKSIFSSAVFNSLVSFEEPIPDQAILRPNPFAPIGNDASGFISNSTSSQKTR